MSPAGPEYRRRYVLALLLLAVALVITLIFAISGWVRASNAQVKVNDVEAASIADKRAKVYSDFAGCIGQIKGGKLFRPALLSLRNDFRERAIAAWALADLAPEGSEERKLRLRMARSNAARATAFTRLLQFPSPTKTQCKARRDKALGVIGNIDV